ncbi:MAG: RNA-protein complex protein Nop10 [Methanomicrobiales archaeon]|nr:RNA-protein complex protein Nop10 [Methanomicrobiales archaeon]NYT20609.1 RNA-protein complex protein Nop10 [Methanomicrobiales archaeon]
MTARIRRCPLDFTYTLRDTCPVCGNATASPHPARFSPEDRYGRYRRIARTWMT